MFKAEISQRKKVILFLLLIVLNIVLRIPSIPHEKGADSFFIHSLSNSVTSFGYANWWVHWLSVFGYYPYSYASAIPFSLSGLSQITGIEMETTILLFCVVIGLFSVFSAYLLAGIIFDEFLFKYLMALFYSISPSIMFFSTWEISARGPFIIFLPLFIYLIMKNLQYAKRVLLIIISVIFLFSIHHLAIILIPIISIFIAINLVSKIKIDKNKSSYLNSLYAAGLVAAFMLPFLKPDMTGITGSRYGWIINSMIISVRYIGPMVFFAFSGLVFLIFKKDKKVNLWCFLCMVVLFIPFIYDQIYGIYIVQLFLIVPVAVGFRNLFNLKDVKSSKLIGTKLIGTFIIVILLSSVIFSCYYNHYRTGPYKGFWYMDEKTYTAGNWIDHNINKENRVLIVSENYYNVRSIALQQNGSAIVTDGPEGLTYGFIDKNIIKNLEKVPITDSYFFSEGPYKITEKDKYNSISWYLSNKDISVIKKVYNLDYLMQSTTYRRPIGLLEKESEKVFSNGILEIYNLRNI